MRPGLQSLFTIFITPATLLLTFHYSLQNRLVTTSLFAVFTFINILVLLTLKKAKVPIMGAGRSKLKTLTYVVFVLFYLIGTSSLVLQLTENQSAGFSITSFFK